MCTIKDTETEHSMLDDELDNSAIITKAICGPHVCAVLATLSKLPDKNPDNDDIGALKMSITNAEREALVVCNLPQAYKDIAQAQLVGLRAKLLKLEQKHDDDVNAEPLTFVMLDKSRATLVAQRDAWVSRVATRKQSVYEEAKHTMKAIDDAQSALILQKAMLQEKLDLHEAAWGNHNLIIKESFLNRISNLTQKCECMFVSMSDGDDKDIDDKVIRDLHGTLAAAHAQIAAQQQAMEAAQIRYQAMEARMAMMAPLPCVNREVEIPDSATTSEVTAETTKTLAASTSGADDGKGKSKGSKGAHGHY
jgi:hypothetical protein